MKNKYTNPVLSVVIPLYNEEAILPALIKRLAALSSKLPKQTEIIFVDDGSRDKTKLLIKKTKLPFNVKLLEFSRNFGHQSALLAGLKEAKGNYVVSMDGDLQHPPELIIKMLALHRQGFEIVLTRRTDTSVTAVSKKLTAKLFYWLINALSSTPIEPNSSDFRSLNRQALDSLLAMPEHRKFLRGMVQWIGFETVILPFTVSRRAAGESKYSTFKMVRLALHGLTSFSTMPLFWAGIFSLILFLAAALYAAYVIYVRFFGAGVVEGWASVLFVTLIIGGFISLFVGLLGIYLAALYDEVKGRPEYLIKAKYDSSKR
jgi:dolichol-phosphate mannosyltransferase